MRAFEETNSTPRDEGSSRKAAILRSLFSEPLHIGVAPSNSGEKMGTVRQDRAAARPFTISVPLPSAWGRDTGWATHRRVPRTRGAAHAARRNGLSLTETGGRAVGLARKAPWALDRKRGGVDLPARRASAPFRHQENALPLVETAPDQIIRKLPGGDGEQLADLTGIQRDLRLVGDACRIIRVRREAPAAAELRRACFDSAVMRYRRCFNSGVRGVLSPTLPTLLNTDEKALHDRILEIADKSVAHCVDGSEENTAYLRIGPKSGEKVTVELSVFSRTISHHNRLDIEAFENLALKVAELARKEADALARSIMTRLETMTTNEILALPVLESDITDEGHSPTKKYGSRTRKR